MAFAHYKALEEFEFRNKKVRRGDELVMSSRDGDTLIKERKVTEGRFLDPNEPKDKAAIEEAEREHEAEHQATTEKETARESKKDVALRAKDKEKQG